MIGPNDDVFYESAEEAFRSILSACQPRDGDRFNGPATDEDRERLGMVINYSEAMIAALSPPPGDAPSVTRPWLQYEREKLIAEEREACAKECIGIAREAKSGKEAAIAAECVEAIRARGKENG